MTAFMWLFVVFELAAVLYYFYRQIGDEFDLGALSLDQVFHIRGRMLFVFLLMAIAGFYSVR